MFLSEKENRKKASSLALPMLRVRDNLHVHCLLIRGETLVAITRVIVLTLFRGAAESMIKLIFLMEHNYHMWKNVNETLLSKKG